MGGRLALVALLVLAAGCEDRTAKTAETKADEAVAPLRAQIQELNDRVDEQADTIEQLQQEANDTQEAVAEVEEKLHID